MTELLVAGKRVTLDPAAMLGKGGEADVYRVAPDVALKVFKDQNHPDIKNLPKGPERDLLTRQAKERLAEHQKKLPAFPRHLPSGIVSPIDLARDGKGMIRGYTMPLVPGARELLMLHADKDLRKQLDPANLIALFRRLHELVVCAHQAGLVIGDFNDLNILVKDPSLPGVVPFLIDADSMQFGPFPCRMFTARFVDPLVCDATAQVPMLVAPHRTTSDWFAFAAMLFETLLWVGPFGGVHAPKDVAQRISHDARSLKRMSVLNPEVRYPKPARPYGTLPDDLLQYFLRVFEHDHREVFPKSLLENLRWTTCTDCGYTHARSMCPMCGVADPSVSLKVVVRGSVTARRIFPTPLLRGDLLTVAFQEGELTYLVHDAGQVKREDGSVVLKHSPTPDMRFRLSGHRTFIGQGPKLVVVDPRAGTELLSVDTLGHRPMFDTDATALYRVVGGRLVREGKLGVTWEDHIGDVLAGQTMIFVGEKFGFGFYRAGAIFQAFTFTDAKRSLNDRITLPPIPGQLVDAFALFSSHRVWFFVAYNHQGKLLNRCTVLDHTGGVIATHETQAGDGSWLSSIRGGCAATLPGSTHSLFVPTDEGIKRIDATPTGLVEARVFTDTEPFVHASSRLFLARGGIVVVKDHEIHLLEMK